MGSFVYTPEKEAARQAVNEFIRTSGEFDGVVDFDAATRDPADPTRLQAAYDGGDGLHPNDAGSHAMGNAANLRHPPLQLDKNSRAHRPGGGARGDGHLRPWVAMASSYSWRIASPPDFRQSATALSQSERSARPSWMSLVRASNLVSKTLPLVEWVGE